MDLTSLAIAIIVIILLFLIIRLVMKTIKIAVGIIIIVAVLGVWLYGFSGFFDKVSDVKESIPELEIQKIARSITGCTADEECAYIIDTGDCRQVKGYCNNILKDENYKKIVGEEVLEEACNLTSVQTDYNIDCECKLHQEREGKIKQWISKIIEQKVSYTYCWKKE